MFVQIFDKYAEKNGTFWLLCPLNKNVDGAKVIQKRDTSSSVIFITSYLNTIHVRQRSAVSGLGLLNATVRVQPGMKSMMTSVGYSSFHDFILSCVSKDLNYKLKLISTTDDWVESCQPNPCQFKGKCISSGTKQMCQCKGHFTGRFCGLTMCELDPCVFGQCELTSSGFKV